MSNGLSIAERLAPLFMPQSVAIIGASATPFKHGNVALKYLVAGGFEGAVYPVNAGGGEIEGLPVFKSILDIPGSVDCALFLIPAAVTNTALRDCARKGVRAVIFGSSGFAEQGTEQGRAIQAEMVEIARAHRIAILGPNTNGIWNASHKMSLGYNTSHGDVMQPGSVSIAAHSGALMNSIAPALREFGVSLCKYVPVGNEANVDLNDIFEYLIDDAYTRVIGLIIEGISDGPRFRALAHRAREAGKAVVALKLGKSKAGAAAAQAHASRLAGSARAYEAFLRGCAVLQVDGIESLAGACALLSNGLPQKNDGDAGLVAISTSGGGAELLADHADAAGITLAGDGAGHWPASVSEHFAKISGSGIIRNPVDAGNLGGVPNIAELISAIEAEKCNGPVVLFAHQLPQEARDLLVARLLIERRARTGSPVVCISPGGLRQSVARFYADNGVHVFRDTKTCFDVLKCYMHSRAAHSVKDDVAKLSQSARDNIAPMLANDEALLTEVDAASVLSTAGVHIVQSFVAASVREAMARMTGSNPWVLKCIVPGIAHKNDAGLVATNISTAEEMSKAWESMERNLARTGSDRARCTFLLQPMLASRSELIAGVAHEPGLGHFLIAGLGGLLAEAIDEIVMIPVPASVAEIRAAISDSRLGKMLDRLDRDGSPASRGLVETLAALQSLTTAFPDRIRSIDVNPLLVGRDHCTAVDALIELHTPSTGA
jgi:acyl-CoA synthetase (NDP forming)